MKKIIALVLVLTVCFVGIKSFAHEKVIRIGIIDTGITDKHGLIDMERVVKGKNYAFDTENTEDFVGHGTAVASIILDNCKNAQIVPLVYYSKYPTGVVENGGVDAICTAIYHGVDIYNCQIINISSGIKYHDDRLKDAIDYANQKGVIVISAVGNENIKDKDAVYYPSAYSNVVGVGSADGLMVADFSQRGQSVYVLANGIDIDVVGTKNSQMYKKVSGTSYSAAYVSALAGDILEIFPKMTPQDFMEILKYSSTDMGALGYDLASGYGLINPELAIEKAQMLQNGNDISGIKRNSCQIVGEIIREVIGQKVTKINN